MSENKTLPGLPGPSPEKSLYIIAFDNKMDELVTTMVGGQYEYQEFGYMRARLLQIAKSITDQMDEAMKFFDEQRRNAGEHVEDRETLASADLSNATVMRVSVGTDEDGNVTSFTHEEVTDESKH